MIKLVSDNWISKEEAFEDDWISQRPRGDAHQTEETHHHGTEENPVDGILLVIQVHEDVAYQERFERGDR